MNGQKNAKDLFTEWNVIKERVTINRQNKGLIMTGLWAANVKKWCDHHGGPITNGLPWTLRDGGSMWGPIYDDGPGMELVSTDINLFTMKGL